MLATYKLLGTWISEMKPSTTLFLIKMIVQFIMLSCSWCTGFFFYCNIALLFVYITIERMGETVDSSRNLLNLASSTYALLKAWYFASVEERETTSYFFDFHEIKTSPKKTANPLTGLLELIHDPQSES